MGIAVFVQIPVFQVILKLIFIFILFKESIYFTIMASSSNSQKYVMLHLQTFNASRLVLSEIYEKKTQLQNQTSAINYYMDIKYKCPSSGNALPFYIVHPKQIVFGISEKTDPGTGTKNGYQICYPATARERIENPNDDEKYIMNVYDSIRKAIVMKLKQQYDDNPKNPAYLELLGKAMHATLKDELCNDEPDVDLLVKPVFNISQTKAKNTKEDISKLQKNAYFDLIAYKDKQSDQFNIQTKIYHGDKQVPASTIFAPPSVKRPDGSYDNGGKTPKPYEIAIVTCVNRVCFLTRKSGIIAGLQVKVVQMEYSNVTFGLPPIPRVLANTLGQVDDVEDDVNQPSHDGDVGSLDDDDDGTLTVANELSKLEMSVSKQNTVEKPKKVAEDVEVVEKPKSKKKVVEPEEDEIPVEKPKSKKKVVEPEDDEVEEKPKKSKKKVEVVSEDEEVEEKPKTKKKAK